MLKKELQNTSNQLSIVHPKKYLEVVEKYLAEVKVPEGYRAETKKYLAETDPKKMSLKRLISALPFVIMNALKRRLFRK